MCGGHRELLQLLTGPDDERIVPSFDATAYDIRQTIEKVIAQSTEKLEQLETKNADLESKMSVLWPKCEDERRDREEWKRLFVLVVVGV